MSNYREILERDKPVEQREFGGAESPSGGDVRKQPMIPPPAVCEKKAAIGNDISSEVWREYSYPDGTPNGTLKYKIHNPVRMFMRAGGTTHRVLDGDGIVHVVPAPGHNGCVLRYRPRDVDNWCQF